MTHSYVSRLIDRVVIYIYMRVRYLFMRDMTHSYVAGLIDGVLMYMSV